MSQAASGRKRPVPALDTPDAIAAYRFMKSLHDEYQVVPATVTTNLPTRCLRPAKPQ